MHHRDTRRTLKTIAMWTPGEGGQCQKHQVVGRDTRGGGVTPTQPHTHTPTHTCMCPDTASSLTPDSIHVWFSSKHTYRQGGQAGRAEEQRTGTQAGRQAGGEGRQAGGQAGRKRGQAGREGRQAGRWAGRHTVRHAGA